MSSEQCISTMQGRLSRLKILESALRERVPSYTSALDHYVPLSISTSPKKANQTSSILQNDDIPISRTPSAH
ncbi:hypothetical protein BTUL_0009g01050 [Botrytis tulipae]|uniref:Uncharacterized protein n=1 Tax=Botrytis tulipae TaxID=87230 RepID=A0A4Z1F2G6_9HELO|nr:hypothetical protein BTUL_0009g01050 [Botrytis tulipae]